MHPVQSFTIWTDTPPPLSFPPEKAHTLPTPPSPRGRNPVPRWPALPMPPVVVRPDPERTTHGYLHPQAPLQPCRIPRPARPAARAAQADMDPPRSGPRNAGRRHPGRGIGDGQRPTVGRGSPRHARGHPAARAGRIPATRGPDRLPRR